jgi:hypothetical protein
MKKSTKTDMGIHRCLYKLLRNGPQRCDRAVEGLDTASSASARASPRPRSPPSAAWRKAASAHLVVHWGSKYGIEEFSRSNSSAWAASTGKEMAAGRPVTRIRLSG